MRVTASKFEMDLSEATGKSILMVRAHTARMVAEILHGKILEKQHSSKLAYRILATFPQKNNKAEGRKTIYVGPEPEPDYLPVKAILQVVDQTLSEIENNA